MINKFESGKEYPVEGPGRFKLSYYINRFIAGEAHLPLALTVDFGFETKEVIAVRITDIALPKFSTSPFVLTLKNVPGNGDYETETLEFTCVLKDASSVGTVKVIENK